MMFTCHECQNAGLDLACKFDTWEDLTEHRAHFHALHYVNGLPFWMLEVKINRVDYFWVARTTQDKAWLKWIGWKA